MSQLDALLFTHFHVDHSGDFAALIMSSWFEDRRRPLPVYGPPGNDFMPLNCINSCLIRAATGFALTSTSFGLSEVKADLSADRARRNVMGSAERGKKVVQSIFIRHVDNLNLSAPLVTVAMKQIVVTNSNVEQVSWGDAGRIVIGIFCARCRHLDQR